MDSEDYPWADFFMASSNPYYGWVRDVEAAQAVVTEYSFATSTSYAYSLVVAIILIKIICCKFIYIHYQRKKMLFKGAVVTEYSFATSTSYAIPRCTIF
jgi:hypothetical protein